MSNALRLTADPALEAMARQVVDSAFQVHHALGPGLLEGAYEACLVQELSLRDLAVRRQVSIPIRYGGIHLDVAFRADLIVGERLLVELKCVSGVLPIHRAQAITYLKLLRLPLCLLINSNSVLIRDGIERVLNVPRRKRPAFSHPSQPGNR